MRISGRISPRKAAQMLDVNVKTIHTWCQKALAGEPSRFSDVVQHVNGYFWISLDEVKRLIRPKK